LKEKPLPLGRMMMNTKYQGKRIDLRPFFILAGVLLLLLLGVAVMVQGYFHELPEGLSVESRLQPVDDIRFLTDLTYPHGGEVQREQAIFSEILTMVEEAETFIVGDFFLFNDAYDKATDYPNLTQQLTEALIAKKEEIPEIRIILITDEINNFYGAYEASHFAQLMDNGIDVVVTDPQFIGNSNPLYTGIWSTLIRPFGTGDIGLFPNPFDREAPRITLRSILRLPNFKANHRKVLVTETSALVTSANPHDASAHHSNIAFRFSGPLVADLLATEKSVALLSGYESANFPTLPVVDAVNTELKATVQARVLTEGKIREHLLNEISHTQAGDHIWMGQFYIGDRLVVEALVEAAARDVSIQMILDPNKDAFGIEKNGIPNRPVAAELVELSEGAIQVRWYNTQGEQFHTKLTLIQRGDESIVFGGSANLTKRNIGDKNLETMLKIHTPRNSNLSNDITAYFRRLWGNRGGQFTLRYEDYADTQAWRHWLYRFQEWSGFSTF